MKNIGILIICFGLISCASNPAIQRTYYEAYEQQVGFTQVVQYGNRLYISGVTSPGPEMEQAVNNVYTSLTNILKQHGASMGDVVKENLYTTDMAALKTQIPLRKKYYPKDQYPAATWVEVTGLFMPELILEVELEVVLTD